MKRHNFCSIFCFFAFLTIQTVFLLGSIQVTYGQQHWYQSQSDWNGYNRLHFQIAQRDAYLVTPKIPAEGNPWIWRARFPDFHAQADIQLLAEGYHVAYVNVAGLYGGPQAMEIADAFFAFLTDQRQLSKKPILEGVSRGGLFVYNWAARHPNQVACIYCDTPVLDFKSWPAGKGTGIGAKNEWQQCLTTYGLDEESAVKFNGNPVDNFQSIVAANIPILHIVSENDQVVPPAENTYLLQKRMDASGHKIKIISVPEGTPQSNGHHFTHPEPETVVNFIKSNSLISATSSQRMALLTSAKRILFLGDSITFSGEYVANFEAWLVSKELENSPVIINVGLPSETVSGLSEDGHAGGNFPRPDLHERLDRVLNVTKPDLIFACYGINCGIYQPFDLDRFQKYQEGIVELNKKALAIGAKIIFITPATFDDQQAKKAFSYNEVLDQYSAWLMEQSIQNQWNVIDLHSGMNHLLASARKADPTFTFQPDAVHPNAQGHWAMTRQMIRWFGDVDTAKAPSAIQMFANAPVGEKLIATIRQRQLLQRDAYLSAAKHKRPGIAAGLPVSQAEAKALELDSQIQDLWKATTADDKFRKDQQPNE